MSPKLYGKSLSLLCMLSSVVDYYQVVIGILIRIRIPLFVPQRGHLRKMGHLFPNTFYVNIVIENTE